ncbi:hypothetical protein P2318_29665 [Myxococcaceae bacterium GXIMD 01537]
MARRLRVLGGAVAALALLASCGVSEEEAVTYRDETARQFIRESEVCTSLGCPLDPRAPNSPIVCVEVFFEFGRSPALCLPLENLCEQFSCQAAGRKCVVFEGFPGQVKCIDAQ